MQLVIRYQLNRDSIPGLHELIKERCKVDSEEALAQWRKRFEALRWSDPLLRGFEKHEIKLDLSQGTISIVNDAPAFDVTCGMIRQDVRLDPKQVDRFFATLRFTTPPGERRKLGTYGINGENFFVPVEQQYGFEAKITPGQAYASGMLVWESQDGGRYRFDAQGDSREALSELLMCILYDLLRVDRKWLESRKQKHEPSPGPTEPTPKVWAKDPDGNWNPNLSKRVDEVEFAVRTDNSLRNAGITEISQLVQKTEDDLFKRHKIGKMPIRNIKYVLEELGLSLGMNLEGFSKQTPTPAP